jgi:uncharacterized protein (TIGR01244 family)
MVKGSRALTVAVLLGIAAAAAAGPPEQAPGIANSKRLHERLAVGGTISPEAMTQLKAMGFKTVVDLRTEAEGTAAEKAAVEALGLRYVSVPVTAAALSLREVEAVADVLADGAAAPVLLHCASSNRVGGVYGVVQVLEGKSLAEAEAAARDAGLSSGAITEAMRRVAAEAEASRSQR